jgi:WD40 repeat protein
MNRVSREVTQRAIVAGSVIKDRGMKVWETYWNSGTNQPGNRASYPQGGPVPVSHLPPTHGYNGPLNESHDAQVAIFDLERFIDAEEAQNKHGKSKNALSPIASFDLASGCSYLSFAPAGLHLLTISRKGDVQNVWSLMRIKDQRAGLTFGINTRPVVRNIFKATRMTITKVIDVVWFEPHGHRFALLSENGTVHIHDIPASRFKWPPSRLTSKTKPTQRSQSEEAQSRKSGYSGMAFSAVTGASQWAQSVRQRSLSGQIGFGSLALTPANFSKKAGRNLIKHGTNVIVRGATDIYHVKDNKLSLQSTLDVLKSRSIRLLTGRGLHGYLGVVAAGTVYLYQIKTVISSRSSNGPTKYHAKISKKAMNFSLGSIPSDQFAPAVVSIIEKRNGIPSSLSDDTTVHGHWLLRAPQPSLQRAQRVQREDWRNMVEFTTNPAHIAFHQDGRVSLFAFPEPTQSLPRLPDRSSTQEDFEQYDADRRVYDDEVLKPHIRATHHINDESVWLFGEALLNLRLIKEGSGGYTLGEDEDGDLEYNMVKLDDGTGTLVLNTVPRSSRADEEFFEDGAELVDYSEGIGRA